MQDLRTDHLCLRYVSADGRTVMKWATHPKNEIQSRSSLQWSYQQRPTDKEWVTWIMTLLEKLGITTNCDNIWHLHKPLGHWIHHNLHNPKHICLL